jgi:hypothetical protein
MSPPTGIPLARHITRTPSGSRFDFVARDDLGQVVAPTRLRSSCSRGSLGPIPPSGRRGRVGSPAWPRTAYIPISDSWRIARRTLRGWVPSSPDYTRSCRSGLMSPRSQRVDAASPIDRRLARRGRRPRSVAHGSRDTPLLEVGWITRSGVGPRRHARTNTDEAGRIRRRAPCLRGGGSSAKPDRPLSSKPTDGRAGRVLPVLGLVRGSSAWIEVRPVRQVRARAGPTRPRSDGEHRPRWGRVGRSHGDHARFSS